MSMTTGSTAQGASLPLVFRRIIVDTFALFERCDAVGSCAEPTGSCTLCEES
jgi:hypothetical protein